MVSEIYDNSFTDDLQKLNISSEAEVFVFPASFAQQRLCFSTNSHRKTLSIM